MGVAYTRSTVTVPGGTPFLYHRLVDDPTTFASIRGLNNNVATSATVAIPPMLGNIVADSDDDDDDDDDDDSIVSHSTLQSVATIPTVTKSVNKPGQVNARQVDDRGTLSIPTNLVRNAGLQSNQKVYARAINNQLVVEAASPPWGTRYHAYTVDANDQIRITQKCLQDAGMPGKQYNLKLNGAQIVIEAA